MQALVKSCLRCVLALALLLYSVMQTVIYFMTTGDEAAAEREKQRLLCLSLVVWRVTMTVVVGLFLLPPVVGLAGELWWRQASRLRFDPRHSHFIIGRFVWHWRLWFIPAILLSSLYIITPSSEGSGVLAYFIVLLGSSFLVVSTMDREFVMMTVEQD